MGFREIVFSLYGKLSGEAAIVTWQARNPKKLTLIFGDHTLPSGNQKF